MAVNVLLLQGFFFSGCHQIGAFVARVQLFDIVIGDLNITMGDRNSDG